MEIVENKIVVCGRIPLKEIRGCPPNLIMCPAWYWIKRQPSIERCNRCWEDNPIVKGTIKREGEDV